MTTNIIPQGPVQALARAAWQSILVTGLLSVVLGVLILVWPGKTLLVAGIIFGIYLVVSGLLQLVAAFAAPASAGMRVLYFISGVLSIVIGVFCFRDELASILLLGLWIGIGWLFRGVAVTMAAISEPGLPGRGWQGFFGVITAIAGVVLIIWPVESVATLAWVAGIWLVVLGVMEMITAFGVRKDAKDLGVPAPPVA
ncbi:HdeD family acid-resistance protein [Nocardia cyriacigeorgica]|uniref:Acid-resistance membrane protein n=1 Tax=Nocardia cyriacigeorgica TaxID=135487 RepID=A0A4U8VX00_9NOCA|nr:HdeD family acid-resistance protein [Nocardia cyriacigeorgica]MBF6096629.1 HdeD family acid-resistance protein [Nocardia cyriacigeorgica]MBF6162504.1 HdeD family acid-resistance protein [Nocardia cyriacigeorgica]MBF6201512.1 HdeD family acid-resistance protein [Nocardia cyriacigeorgica]MBF6317071.1 HdeD family acid-resistance protein [Nocardia cyriacigeorgica]MBF6347195.1 HdeD family acid-resistance protein [Nocardia cyriacigeorgica]